MIKSGRERGGSDDVGTSVARAKNYVRPFFKSKGQRSFYKQLQAVRRSTPRAALPAVLRLLENNQNYEFPGLGATFPSQPAEMLDVRYSGLKPLTSARELTLATERLTHHTQRLRQSIEALRELDRTLATDPVKGNLELQAFQAKFGYSLACIRREAIIQIETGGLPFLLKRVKQMVSVREGIAYNALCHFYFDLADPTNDIVLAVSGWNVMARSRPVSQDWVCRVLLTELIAPQASHSDFASSILRYGSVSLIDLAIFLRNAAILRLFYSDLSHEYERLEATLSDIFGKDEEATTVMPLGVAWKTKTARTDRNILRASYLNDLSSSVTRWKADLMTLMYPATSPLQGAGLPHVLESTILSIVDSNSTLSQATEYAAAWEDASFKLEKPIADRPILRTAIVAESLRRMARLHEIRDPASVALAICEAPESYRFVEAELLLKIDRLSANADKLLIFAIKELIYRKSRTLDNELERRLAFMRLIPEKEWTGIGTYLRDLSAKSEAAAFLIAKTCTRTFIERLFLLVSSVKDVLEARISVCAWQCERGSDERAVLLKEKEALERELSNLDARSDLDSTRIHVDEEALREWFMENQPVSRYLQSVVAEGANAVTVPVVSLLFGAHRRTDEVEEMSADGHVGSEVLFVSLLEETLKIFATDKSFGLDAYLSRRIRHGTLSGQLMTPVTRALKRAPGLVNEKRESRNIEQDKETELCVDSLLKSLAADIDHVRREIIQIRSDSHPHGLIKATWRTVSSAAHVDAASGRLRRRVLEGADAEVVFEGIHALCWDCLESDLAQLRQYMIREYLPAAVHRIRSAFDFVLPNSDREAATPAFREALAALQTRVLEVCGWFIRPVFRQDEYDLRTLIESTFSIVRELDEAYRFSEVVEVQGDILLTRGSFDVVGDVLYVLLGNAARHGKPNGTVSVRAGLPGSERCVEMLVKSEVASIDEWKIAQERIRAAFNA